MTMTPDPNVIKLREAARHARNLFPGSVIGEVLHNELLFFASADRRWAVNAQTLRLSTEIFRLHNAGFVLPDAEN